MKRWRHATIGESCQITSGGTPSKKVENYWVGKTPWVSAKDLKSDRIEDAELHISGKAVDESATKIAPTGSLLMLVRGMGLANGVPIGEVISPVAFNQDIRAIHPPSDILPRFLLLAIRNSLASGEGEQVLSNAAHGTLKIDGDALRRISFPIPPIPEQRRIVAILDEAFEDIAAANVNAERSLENARAIFEGHLDFVFTQQNAAWVSKPLESLCALFVDSAHRTPEYQAEGIPALRPRDVVHGNLVLSAAARVSENEYEIQTKRHRPRPGDVVYSRELSYGWAVALPDKPRVCLSQGMCLFRPASAVNTEFLLYALNGPVGRGQAKRAAVGTSHPHINLGDIKRYRIPLPSLAEQARLVRQFDAVRQEVRSLESAYRRKLAALDELKQSLLHQAFSGNL